MTDVATVSATVSDAEIAGAPRKKGKLGLILGLVLAAGLGGGGFMAVRSGLFDPMALLGGGAGHGAAAAHGESGQGETAGIVPAELEGIAFVPMEPIMISLPPGRSARVLRFSGQLEVAPENAGEVAALMPRVLDVLNGYLRAVEVSDLESPAAMPRLRAQMLRRVQVVTGEGLVRDLLVTEFVLN